VFDQTGLCGKPGLSCSIRAQKSTRVCQVVGDYDRTLDLETQNLTAQNAFVAGTDLGSSFVYDDLVIFLFGDTATGRTRDEFTRHSLDSIAVANKSSIRDFGVDLNFVTREDTRTFKEMRFDGGDVRVGPMAVPSGGFEHNGSMYVFFTTDAEQKQIHANASRKKYVPTRTVLGRWTPGEGDQFKYIYDFSTLPTEHGSYPNIVPAFIAVSPVKIRASEEIGGLPGEVNGPGLLLYATGFYRNSPVYLAYIDLDELEERTDYPEIPNGDNDRPRATQVYFFAGIDYFTKKPVWNKSWDDHNSDAKPIFTMENSAGAPVHDLGELSVVLDERTGMFYMMYQTASDQPRNNANETNSSVHFRYASLREPWNFSPPQVIYTSKNGRDEGFVHFPSSTAQISDPEREDVPGVVYAPYMIEPKFEIVNGPEKSTETIYYLASTWNPYTVVLMKTVLEICLEPGGCH